MRLFDAGASVDLAQVRSVLGRPVTRAPVQARSPLPAATQFAAPVEASFPLPDGPAGAVMEVRVHALGVIAVRVRWPCDVPGLAGIAQAAEARFGGKGIDELAAKTAVDVRRDLGTALHEPYEAGLQAERYVAYCIHAVPAEVPGLLERNAVAIAQLVSDSPGEDLVQARLAAAHKHTLQYTPGDAVVIGWDHGVILDEAGQYEDVLDVMELANLELLEFRTYDALLDAKLESSFATLDRLWGPGGLFRSARSALRDISRLRVDFARLTDNLHDTGKIFGDWYTAQLHRRLHERFHLASWERAVAAKMDTLEDMFHLAQEEANHRRSLTLEIMIVLLFLLDVFLLVRGAA